MSRWFGFYLPQRLRRWYVCLPVDAVLLLAGLTGVVLVRAARISADHSEITRRLQDSNLRSGSLAAGYKCLVLAVRKSLVDDTLYDGAIRTMADALNEYLLGQLRQCSQVWTSDQATQLNAVWRCDKALGTDHGRLFALWIESHFQVSSFLLSKPGQVEGQVQGGQTGEPEPEIPARRDDGKPQSLEGRGATDAREPPGGGGTVRGGPDKKTGQAALRQPTPARTTWRGFDRVTGTFRWPGTSSRWAWWRGAWSWCVARGPG